VGQEDERFGHHQESFKRHRDEVQRKINGRKHWLRRAVDRDGIVREILIQAWRNQEAAETFWRRLVEGQGLPAAGGHHRQTGKLHDRAPPGAPGGGAPPARRLAQWVLDDERSVLQ
jgi:hypothetical protein